MPVAAASLCAMNGNPVVWSSFPIVALAWIVIAAFPSSISSVHAAASMRVVRSVTTVGLVWMAALVALRLEAADAIAFLGAGSMLVLGFWLGRDTNGSSVAADRLLSAAAIGYIVHAVRLLGWFVERAGWQMADLIRLRWDPSAVEGSGLVGFGNLGNNAMLAAMLLPALVAGATRSKTWIAQAVQSVAACLAVGVLAVTQARAPLVVSAAMLLATLVALRARTMVVCLIVAGAVLMTSSVSNDSNFETNALRRVVQLLQGVEIDASAEERAESIVLGWRLAWDNPMFGVGVSRLPNVMIHTAPHQWCLHQALEWGIVVGLAGAAATLAMIVAFIRALHRAWRCRELACYGLIFLSIPTTYLMIGTVAGAQWHYGLASVWPALCGIGFGVAWSMETRTLARAVRGAPLAVGGVPDRPKIPASSAPGCSCSGMRLSRKATVHD